MFDWTSYHTLAIELSERTELAAHRSAISRAYYAVFHAACRYVTDVRGEALPRREKHEAVWSWFAPAAPIPGRTRLETKVGSKGRRLRERRNDADYESGIDASKLLSDSMKLARELLDDIDELIRAQQPD